MLLSLLALIATALAADPLDVAAEQLAEAEAAWSGVDDAPYYVAVALEDVEGVRIAATDGAIDSWQPTRVRTLDVDLRVGTPELDSTHDLRGFSGLDDDPRRRTAVAWGGPGEAGALRLALWRALDSAWQDAREKVVLLDSERSTRVDEEDPAPDFEVRAPVVAERPVPALALPEEAWAERLRGLSERLVSDAVVESRVQLDARREVVRFLDTDGARLVHGRVHVRLSMQAEVVADDGDRITVFDAIDLHDPTDLPDAAALDAMADRVVARAGALRAAPRVSPYTGPVLLSGRAAAVFVHEVLGHRVEGHRNKSDFEGKTFLDLLGRPVAPAWLTIHDDPAVAHLEGHDLNGHYAFDDEGVAAQDAPIIEEGVFRGFLMGRSPLAQQPTSNGHGRRSAGHPPTSRMGNTIVEVEGGLDDAALRRRFVAELRRQGLEYGYVVEEIDGGFTMTGRVTPNAFNVRASRTRRVYADGRPDELVRGIDLVGTPLVALRSLLAAGDHREVFNGTCGAESGWVPVSAVSPPLLFERLEMQLKEKGSTLPPLLPPPGRDGTVSGEAP